MLGWYMTFSWDWFYEKVSAGKKMI